MTINRTADKINKLIYEKQRKTKIINDFKREAQKKIKKIEKSA